MGDLKEQVGLLSKEEVSNDDRFSEDSESQIYIFPLRKNFFGEGRFGKQISCVNIWMLLSFGANAAFVFIFLMSFQNYGLFHINTAPQGIARLVPNAVKQTMSTKTLYSNPPNLNTTLRDELWANIKYDRGSVLIDEETVARLGLDQEARTFPWDPTKRVFFLNAFHQLHCLKGIYEALTQVHHGEPLQKYEHHVHCLDALRQDVMCAADDELLYVTKNHEANIGDGHVRQCRDFDKLDQWALENSACYTFEKLEPPFFVDQTYANCPQDSPYYQGMIQELGFPDGWEPPFPPSGPAFPA